MPLLFEMNGEGSSEVESRFCGFLTLKLKNVWYKQKVKQKSLTRYVLLPFPMSSAALLTCFDFISGCVRNCAQYDGRKHFRIQLFAFSVLP